MKFITDFLIIYNLKRFFNFSYPTLIYMWFGSAATLLGLKFHHVCGCADRFRTLLLVHIHDNVAMHHEKTPEDQTGHHRGSSLSARSKFKYLVTRTERSAKTVHNGWTPMR